MNYPGVTASMVSYGDGAMAFLALPEKGSGPFGAVMLGHERYGLVQHTFDLTAKFAAHGYVGLAPDMFSHWEGDKAALHRGSIRVDLPAETVTASMAESLDFLLSHPRVDRTRIAAMGVCQSGEYPFLLNSVRKEVAANVVVYGGTGTGEDVIAAITAPVIGIWGERDHVISVDDVQRLRAVLEAKRKSYEFTLFPGMPHGWLNSTMPGRYREKEASEAWRLIVDFLGRVFSGAFPSDRMHWRFQSDVALAYDFSKNIRLE